MSRHLSVGAPVTWTYLVTSNQLVVVYLRTHLVVRDDNGTPFNPNDDFEAALDPATDDQGDGRLAPGETWTYTAAETAQDLNGSSQYGAASVSSSWG